MENSNDQLAKHLQRNNELLLVIAKVLLARTLSEELASDKLKKLYDLTGKSTVKEISASLRMSVKTISDAWQRWEKMGLLIKDGKSYRRTF